MKKILFIFTLLLSVEALSQVRVCSGDLARVQATKYHDGVIFKNGLGKMGTVYCNISGDNIVDKPIIIAEGFDFLETAGLGSNTDGFDVWDFMNTNGFAESLRRIGYDFFILDYDDPLASIPANALLLGEVIKTINSRKVGIFKNIVIGFSMGGLVAKSALAYMEYDGIGHETSLYLSIDSPHGCAQINRDLQNNIRLASGQGDPIASNIWRPVLGSNAAMQMICQAKYQESGDSIFDLFTLDRTSKVKRSYRTYMNRYSLKQNGFPSHTRNVSFTNGGGTKQGFEPGDKLVDFAEVQAGPIKLDIDIHADELDNLDSMPGSTGAWFSMLHDLDMDDLDYQVLHTDVTYIPTISAIGLYNVIDYEGKDELYWEEFKRLLLMEEYDSEVTYHDPNDVTELDVMRSQNLFMFLFADPEPPKTYLTEAWMHERFPTKVVCYDFENSDGVIENRCGPTPILDADLTEIENLAELTPFDEVYIATSNHPHSTLPVEHAQSLLSEILNGTTIQVEKILPALLLTSL